MPIPVDDTSDFEKLQAALSEITSKFGSVDNVLEAFGLLDMPIAQRYGILFGCLVFLITVSSVMLLLIFGGTFKRIAEEAESGTATIESVYKMRQERPLLLERLLDARERLLSTNYPDRMKQRKERQASSTTSTTTTKTMTNLTRMLMSIAPPKDSEIAGLTDDNSAKIAFDTKDGRAEEMIGYKENFMAAYRRCQDKPGGAVLPGKPEARFEAFARAYASCGDKVRLSYRRAYGRLYETMCCETQASEDKYSKMYEEDPTDIVGRTVRLQALDCKRHLRQFYAGTSGDVYCYNKSYDANEVWGFLEEGPFETEEDMQKSFVFQHQDNEAAFAIIQNENGRLVGVIMLRKDDPANLSIQMDPPIVAPSNEGTKEQLEACFLLMDRLFANGYRRIQLSVDDKDTRSKKLADRLGFTLEGCLLKDMIIKDSSRDSAYYGMLNSDWDKGARGALSKKFYGVSVTRTIDTFNAQEEELDEQKRGLAQKKMV